MIYKISKHNYFKKYDFYSEMSLNYVDVILVSIEKPSKRKSISMPASEFNPDDYKIGYKYDIKKFLWLEKWSWVQPD